MSISSRSPAERIKNATAEEHRLTEQQLNIGRATDPNFGPAELQQLAHTNFQVWSAFCAQLQTCGTGWWAPYVSLLTNIAAAAALDLKEFSGVDLADFPEYPATADGPELAGCLYVHLGSLLGGRIIHRALVANERLSSYSPFRFYAAGADFGGADWRQFIVELNERLNDPVDLERAIEQARRIFLFYREVHLAAGGDR